MPKSSLIARPRIRWVFPLVFALFGVPFLALAFLLLSHSGSGAGVFLLIIGLAFPALGASMLRLASRSKIRLTPERIGFGSSKNWREVGWDQLVTVLTVEHVTGAERRARWRRHDVHLVDDTRFSFFGEWENSEQVAGSLQCGRFDPAARFDRAETVVMGDGNCVLSAPVRPDPAMALGVGRQRLDRWLGAVAAALRDGGDTPEINGRMLEARAGENVFELFSMARATIGEGETDWAGGIQAYLDRARQTQAEAIRFLEAARDFVVAKPQLRLQLHFTDHMQGQHVISEPLGKIFQAVLVIARPNGEATVDRTFLDSWNRAREEVLAVARENLVASSPPPRKRRRPDGLLRFQGDDFCAARVLVLERLMEVRAELGAIVHFPPRLRCWQRPWTLQLTPFRCSTAN